MKGSASWTNHLFSLFLNNRSVTIGRTSCRWHRSRRWVWGNLTDWWEKGLALTCRGLTGIIVSQAQGVKCSAPFSSVWAFRQSNHVVTRGKMFNVGRPRLPFSTKGGNGPRLGHIASLCPQLRQVHIYTYIFVCMYVSLFIYFRWTYSLQYKINRGWFTENKSHLTVNSYL